MDTERSGPEAAPRLDLAATGATAATERPTCGRPSSSGRRPRRAGAGATVTDGLDDLATAYDQLLEISRRAFAGSHQAVAYHALAAALHAARDLEDQRRLEEIEVVAQEQMRAVDASTPSSPLSTAAATYRGMVPLWVSLARQAETAKRLCHTAKASQQWW